ncbi:MAG: hypothetical protein JWN14_480 [Chthonomonadales bacterium]|nr:hypothetical protein [Chthonomonadales bacterium]
MTLHFDPPFGPVQTAALLLLTVGVALALYLGREMRRSKRHPLLIVLRSAVILLLALLLLNPVATLTAPQAKRKAPFLLLLDTSRSMTTRDVPTVASPETRWQAARRATLDNHALIDALAQRYEVRTYGFDAHIAATDRNTLRAMESPKGDRTSLGDALTQAVSANRPADATGTLGGVLLVSDGRDNGQASPLDAARTAKSLGFPVYTLCVGQETKSQDVAVVAQRSQVFAEPGQQIEFTVDVRDTGIPPGPATMELLRDGKRVATQSLTLGPGRHEVSFPVVEAHRGFYRYAVACSPLPGETDLTNNRANIFLNVMDSHARVLLLEGQPTWDSKFLAQTLRDDPTLRFDSVFQLTDTRPFAVSGSAAQPIVHIPHTVDDFAHYDVLLLGRGYESFFDAKATEELKKWVGDRGGCLVFLRGRADEHTAGLRDLEPLVYGTQELATAQMRLTDAGRSHPGFAFDTGEDAQTIVKKLPSLITATRVKGEKALAVVLARSPDSESGTDSKPMATLAYQRFGQGKVMAVVGQGLWRWAFLPPDQEKYRKVYPEFWAQTVRWLVSESDFLPGQNIALRTDKTTYSGAETVNLLGFLRGPKVDPPQITLTLPGGQTTSLTPARGDGKTADFTASYHPPAPGEYLATVAPPPGNTKAVPVSAAFTVFPGQEEDANRSADPALMQQIAAIGGGQLLQPTELNSLPEKLRSAELSSVKVSEPRTLWDRWWVLAALIGLLATEWLFRRRLGLI